MYKDVKPSWEKSKFPRGNFFIINKNPWLFDPWLFLFLWHCLYCIMDSLSLCRHQNLINFKFLQKQVFIFVTVLIMNKYWAFFSFYGIKIWLRAGKDIFAIFQSVVSCAFAYRFLFPYVIVAYMKYPFSDIFFTQAFETLFSSVDESRNSHFQFKLKHLGSSWMYASFGYICCLPLFIPMSAYCFSYSSEIRREKRKMMQKASG